MFAFALLALAQSAHASPNLAACSFEGTPLAIAKLPGTAEILNNGQRDMVKGASTYTVDSRTSYYFETVRGDAWQITVENGVLGIYNGAAYGKCDVGTASFDVAGLNALVVEANKELPTYQLATCKDEYQREINFNLVPLSGNRVLIKSAYSDERDNTRYAFLADGFKEEGAMGSSYLMLQGFGSRAYNAAGFHSAALERFWFRHSNVIGTDSIEMKIRDEYTYFSECKMHNVWFLKQTLPNGTPE